MILSPPPRRALLNGMTAGASGVFRGCPGYWQNMQFICTVCFRNKAYDASQAVPLGLAMVLSRSLQTGRVH